MSKCLMIGNGINLLSGNGQSWIHVLEELAKQAEDVEIMELSDQKPFSLIYEEISVRSKRFKNKNEIELKKHVASLVSGIKPNDYHKKIIESNTKNIITTNYDYSFENSCSNGSSKKSNLAKETKYSNFRRRTVNNKNIWHIHGEAEVPNSITLGYDQYSGTLQKMRNYLTGDRNNSETHVSPFKKGIEKFEDTENVFSWLDIFLRDEVHIIGLGFDYTEIDLWWLLSYKARVKLNKSLNVGNTTFHFLHDEAISEKEKAKHSIMKSLGVTVKTTKVNGDYKSAYDDLIKNEINA